MYDLGKVIFLHLLCLLLTLKTTFLSKGSQSAYKLNLMNIKYILPVLLALFITSACENELDVNSDWEDTTVVYGLLDPEADTNFVLIQRGYLGEEPASASFNSPDSFYYPSLDVQLNWYSTTSGALIGNAALIVDFTSRKLNNNGPFGEAVQNAHRLYRIPDGTPINNNFEYEIIITKPNGEITTARTQVVERISIFNPTPLGNPPKYRGTLRFGNASLVSLNQVYVNFHYHELNRFTQEEVTKSVSFEYGEILRRGSGTYELTVGTDLFFERIAARIEGELDDNTVRVFDSLEFEIFGADETLFTYMSLNAPASGINQNRPDFTNITNGIGIFASRSTKRMGGIDLNDQGSFTLKDRLLFNEEMCPLKFIRFEGADTCICNDPVTRSRTCF